jgi:chromosome partitioning protein
MIVCFSTHKGGTGKTTSSINLSAGLARAGKATLLVDMDPQGHSSLGLGIELAYEDANIADVLSDRRLPMEQIIRDTKVPSLFIAPSNLRLASEGEALYAKVKREERLERGLKPIIARYEWIVIDCPPALGVLTANAVGASDAIIVPCHMGARSLDGLGDLLSLVHILKGEEFTDWWILLTMVDARKSITTEIFQDLLKPYQARVLETSIAISEALNQAQIAGEDIFTFDGKSKGAQHYEALTKELLKLYPSS